MTRPHPPRRRDDNSEVSRRSILSLLGAGGLSIVSLSSYSFTSGSASRQTQFGVSGDETGVLGLDISQSVDRGNDSAVFFVLTNNSSQQITVDAEITGTAAGEINFSASGSNLYTFSLAANNEEVVRVSVPQGDPNADTVPFTLTAINTTTGFSATISRNETQVGGNPDPNPGNGEISVVNAGQKGKSGKYDIEWSTGGDTSQFSGVDLYINNQLEDGGLALSGTNTYRLSSGDNVTVELIRNDGSVEDTDSLVI